MLTIFFVALKMKVIIIGDTYVGKTSLLTRWVERTRCDPPISNIGAVFSTKRVEIDSAVLHVSSPLRSSFFSHSVHPSCNFGTQQDKKDGEML